MLVHQYEMFKMLSSESITSLLTRMNINTNILEALGRTYINVKIISKILRFLPKTWEANVTTIREAKYLTKLPLKELIGFLKTHEITIDKQEQEEKPKKNLAFKTIHHIGDDEEDDDEGDHEGIKENIFLIIKYFQSFLKKK